MKKKKLLLSSYNLIINWKKKTY